jgi:hypothetical protein
MFNKATVIIIALVLIGLMVFGYISFTKKEAPASGSPLQSSSQTGGVMAAQSLGPDGDVGDKFLALLLNMRTIKFNQEIFASPSFMVLKDFSTVLIPEGNEGRPNPFAPVGQDVLLPTQTFTVTTNQPTNVTMTSATFVASMSQGAIADTRYFEYGTAETVPLANITARVQQNLNTGAFTFNMTGLLPNTTYYVRAVATINGIVIYGNVVNFKTPVR